MIKASLIYKQVIRLARPCPSNCSAYQGGLFSKLQLVQLKFCPCVYSAWELLEKRLPKYQTHLRIYFEVKNFETMAILLSNNSKLANILKKQTLRSRCGTHQSHYIGTTGVACTLFDIKSFCSISYIVQSFLTKKYILFQLLLDPEHIGKKGVQKSLFSYMYVPKCISVSMSVFKFFEIQFFCKIELWN